MKKPVTTRKPPPPPPPEPPVHPYYNEAMTGQAADVGKTLIEGVTPADKGWVLGFICVVAIIVGSDAWVSLRTIEANRQNAVIQKEYFEKVEENRAGQNKESLTIYADQIRRSQEVIKALAASVARDSERAGDAALFAIQSKSRAEENKATQEGQPNGR